MKITPIAGPSQGAVSPSANTAAETYQQPVPGVRRIKVQTNASPERFEQGEAPAATEVEVKSNIPNTSEEPGSDVTRPISSQFAALAKQKRALQVKEQEIAAREKALTETAPAPGFIDPAELQRNPLDVLKANGVTYDALTEALLRDQSGDSQALRDLQAKIEALEKGFDTKLSERDQQAEAQVLAEMQREANRLVDSAGDEFELIKGTKSQKQITELIRRTWKTTGEVLDVSEAAKLIEDQLVEDNLKLANFGKIRSKLSPAQDARVDAIAQRPGLKTLTNRDTARMPTSKRDRAVAAFFGNLKK
jgi:hypothetical protein